MKKTIILASVAIATLFAFSSCQKENLESNYSANGLRIVTAEFENNTTKTTLNSDGKTPEWEVGDVIRVLNGSAYQDVEIISGSGDTPESGKAYISGSGLIISIPAAMTGTLYAVYPAFATTLESCDGNVSFTIPAIQDGTFASANICVAKGDDKDNLTFRNATAVLKITTADEVVGVDITATNNIAGPVTASFSGNEINLTPSLTGKTVTVVGTTVPSDNVFYLATAPVSTGSTTAICYKTDKEGSTSKDDKDLRRNVIYSMDLSSITFDTDSDLTGKKGILNDHEYVIIKAKYDGTNDSYLKWATMNVGATTVAGSYTTCYGDLYEWGSVETIYNERPWTSATAGDFTDKCKEGKTSGYSCTTYCGYSSFVEWNPAPYNTTTNILNSDNDAATQNWGTGWRMPTSAEFKALYEACGGTDIYEPTTGGSTSTIAKGVYWCASYDCVAGLLFITKDNGPHLFFPAAGSGIDTSLIEAGSDGNYWSSTLSGSINAYCLYFYNIEVSLQNIGFRYSGRSVRPVSD